EILTDADARGPALLRIEEGEQNWHVRQTVHDPAEHHDWVIDAEVDPPASDEEGRAGIRVTAVHRRQRAPRPADGPAGPQRPSRGPFPGAGRPRRQPPEVSASAAASRATSS